MEYSEVELTDKQWITIVPLLPRQKFAKGGRPRADDRSTVNGILWALVSSYQWNDIPKKYSSPMTCWRRFTSLKQSGLWKILWKRYIMLASREQKKVWSSSLEKGSFTPTR